MASGWTGITEDQVVRMLDPAQLLAIDSINYLKPEDAGRIVVAASHGGLYCAYKAVATGVRALILNDAGGGRNQAGIAALEFGNSFGLPVATVSHMSARIGDVADVRSRGIISHANAAANVLGVGPNLSCTEALVRLSAARFLKASPPKVEEHRFEVEILPGLDSVICIDSASLIEPHDAGRVVLTGSHGALIGGIPTKAINVLCSFVAFNDAGVGCDEAGIGRLAPLDQQGVPAVTVAHTSAEIGNARSTLFDGVISYTNAQAFCLGARPGEKLHGFLSAWLSRGGST